MIARYKRTVKCHPLGRPVARCRRDTHSYSVTLTSVYDTGVTAEEESGDCCQVQEMQVAPEVARFPSDFPSPPPTNLEFLDERLATGLNYGTKLPSNLICSKQRGSGESNFDGTRQR